MKRTGRARWLGGIVLTILLYAIAGISAARLLPILRPPAFIAHPQGLAAARVTRTPFLPARITITPFLPMHPTETPLPEPEQPTGNAPAARITPHDFYGIDFSRSDTPIQLEITAPGAANPIRMTFAVGAPCAFSDHRACVHAYTTPRGGNVILVSIHSGVGGEGEPFRQALEGTWINSAAASPQQVETNLAALTGAEVRIRQGENEVEGLELAAAVRIPPARLQEYMNTPVLSAVGAAAQWQPDLAPYANPRKPVIVFEICGWQLPGEDWAPGVTPSSASIYIGVIQDAP